eukprot:7528476-Pyramimonas_sp.AAC.1
MPFARLERSGHYQCTRAWLPYMPQLSVARAVRTHRRDSLRQPDRYRPIVWLPNPSRENARGESLMPATGFLRWRQRSASSKSSRPRGVQSAATDAGGGAKR